MREALLPCTHQYSEVGMWMRFFPRWQHEVDSLRVEFGLSHAEALKKMVLESRADVLMFVEMDGIIFRAGIVDQCFKLIEDGLYDVVASERMSCGPEIARIAKERFNLDYSGLGDKGCAFWPNFFFIKRDILLKTDLNFANKGWSPGDILLGQEVKAADAGDTMVWMSLQLRDLVLQNRIKLVPQYHSHPDDLVHYGLKRGIFDGNASWIHLGSISGNLKEPKTDMERLELTKRLAWKNLCGCPWDEEYAPYCKTGEFNEFQRAYKELLGI